MKIKVRLHAGLKKYAVGGENGVFALDIPAMNGEGLIDYLGINKLDAGLMIINGKTVDYETDIRENDYVQILTELKGG